MNPGTCMRMVIHTVITMVIHMVMDIMTMHLR